MLDSVTKRRIDTARDILVGKVPDPKSQVEQITIGLIYKFMDDMDAESEELGGTRKFFAGDFARYGWAKLMHSGLGGHETLNLYAEAIAKMPENPGVPPLFRDIFKNAFLPYRDPETLRAFLKIIDEFEYDHSERLGDAFEYLLSVLGSQGDAGQFRTPRHIIDFVVRIVNPDKDDTVLDPACGTAGFLISAFKHILGRNVDERGNSTLTPDERARLATNFMGYDISPDMVRLSLVNMYLHGFPSPAVHEYDTLTSETRWGETADVILANPPFMTPTGGIRPHSRFSIQSKRSEVLFLDYIMEHLSPNGRAAVIVPEGVHFVSHTAHTKLRQKLINDGYLLADVTLPHGVFKPYASVKTHILFLDRRLARSANSVLFVEIENDGFTQTDVRDPVEGSQLGVASTMIRSFSDALAADVKWMRPNADIRAYEISKKDLMEGRSSHLLGRWHDLPNRVVHRPGLPLARLGDVCVIKSGLSPNMATPPGPHVLVVPAEERKTADHFDFDGAAVCVPLVSSAGHGKADIKRIHFEEGQFALASTMCALFVKDATRLNPRFLHLFLSAACDDLLVPLMCGATNVTMDSGQLAEVLVPIPPKPTQDEVVHAHQITRRAEEMLRSAHILLAETPETDSQVVISRVIDDLNALRQTVAGSRTVSDFLPT